MIINNNIKFSIVLSIGLISSAIMSTFVGCGYDEECCSLKKSPTAVIQGFKDKDVITATTADQPIFLSVNGSRSFDDGNITQYEWFVNGASVANTMIGNLEVKPGRNEICLVVTDNDNNKNKDCQTIIIESPYEAVAPIEELTCQQKLAKGQGADPTPVLELNDDTNTPVTNHTLERSKTYSLSCANSVDSCGDKVKECEWNATSYLLNADGSKTPYVVDCFNNAEHSGHGAKFTTTDAPPSFIQLCGNANAFNVVEVSLKVTDEYNNTTTTTEIYNIP